jgi:hypothetical protein
MLAADTRLLTIANRLGVAYSARLPETVLREIAPTIGWQRDQCERGRVAGRRGKARRIAIDGKERLANFCLSGTGRDITSPRSTPQTNYDRYLRTRLLGRS